jgi:hypothetical protein
MTVHNSFKGGIKKGTIASDVHSKKLDSQCKSLKDEVFKQLKTRYPGLTLQAKLKKNQIPGGQCGCAPDGGVWFYQDILIAVFEAKKQNDAGNAIERWYKNNYICRKISPNVSYVTFCTGKGANEKGVIWRTLSPAHETGFNKYNPGGNSIFLNTEYFENEKILTIMTEVVVERLKTFSGE